MSDLLLRFMIGGLVVSVFAALGDMVKPESLGGVFAAAPTIAFATLTLALRKHGPSYVAAEARSMVAGAIAFFVYASVVSFVLMRYRTKVLRTSLALLAVWFGAAASMWTIWLRR